MDPATQKDIKQACKVLNADYHREYRGVKTPVRAAAEDYLALAMKYYRNGQLVELTSGYVVYFNPYFKPGGEHAVG